MVNRIGIFQNGVRAIIPAIVAWFVTVTIAVSFAPAVIAQSLSDAEKIRQIDQLLTATYKPADPGAVVIIAKNGQPLLRKAYGKADIENNTPLKPEDVFRIGSITKSFTAMAILLLEEDGKLSVKDQVSEFLPNYPMQGHKITIEHLLTHTSGIAIYTDIPSVRDAITPDATPLQVIDLFKNMPALSAPGEQYDYNNSGYYLLGAVIEKVSGVSYADFLAKRIFKPLGMNDTAYEGQERGAKRVTGYRVQEGRFTLAPNRSVNTAFAAGGLVSSADDLHRWQNAILAEKLLKPATWKRAFTPTILNGGSKTEYGYGWILRKLRGQVMREHSGVIAGFQAMVLTLPQEQLSLVFLTNQQARHNAARHMGERLAALAIGKPFQEFRAITLTDEALTQFEGVYQIAGKPPRNVSRVGKQLRQQAGNNQIIMEPFGANDFFLQDRSFTRYRFDRNPAGKVTRMIRIDSGDEEEVYLRMADLPVHSNTTVVK